MEGKTERIVDFIKQPYMIYVYVFIQYFSIFTNKLFKILCNLSFIIKAFER